MPDQPARPDTLLLRAAGAAVLLDTSGPGLPSVLHWGADLGDLDADARARLVAALAPAVPHSALDTPWPLTLLPGEPDGWSGRPGLAGHRDGADLFPRLVTDGAPTVATTDDGAQELVVDAADVAAGIATRSVLRLEADGLLRVRHTVTNTGAGTYVLAGVTAVLPVPARAGELLDLTGRWCRERSPQRKPFDHGTHARESRRGRTGHDATLLLVAGTAGFGFRHGEVWGVHVAWSGNHAHLAERLAEGAGAGGAGVLGGGELLLPGEVRLAPGESYTSPWVCFSWSGDGLDGLTARVHRWVRARPQHPRRPRPLTLNSWEAVYFDHRLDRLTELAERAAEIGAERFVLDDGWFGSRRDDRSGLGDWTVSDAVWPQGLRPLADRVRGLGMEFGLWFEPEMVNPDSDLVRAHPDWVLGPAPGADEPAVTSGPVDGARLPRPWRRQMVLDLARPEVFDHLLGRISALVDEIGVAYIKWDHNRDLHESLTPGPDGVRRGGVHLQTLAIYRLLDVLRERHPGLEIESCSSGGARVDLGILDRTDRVWASDTNDALERQSIQRWTGLLVPPELVGSHVGPPVAHTTGRQAHLAFRCVTALFGHAGMEWDVTTCTPEEVRQLQGWAGLYKELRGLLHSGDVVRADLPESGPAAGAWLHGVVAGDRREAVYSFVRLTTSADLQPPRLLLPGLDDALEYEVVRRDEAGAPWAVETVPVPWFAAGRTVASGAVLRTVGLAAPLLNPEQAAVLHVRAL
ncbi:MAG: alpha-galactosidase [Actinobacteria bacterium]|nr:alpha-galactosidase [Actinomycetota bacterium]